MRYSLVALLMLLASTAHAGFTPDNRATFVTQFRTFTTSGTFTPPTTGYFDVYCIGGGGGGGGTANNYSGDGGGGGGGGQITYKRLFLGSPVVVRLGAGGARGSSSDGDGGNGGTTRISQSGVTLLEAYGGEFGTGNHPGTGGGHGGTYYSKGGNANQDGSSSYGPFCSTCTATYSVNYSTGGSYARATGYDGGGGGGGILIGGYMGIGGNGGRGSSGPDAASGSYGSGGGGAGYWTGGGATRQGGLGGTGFCIFIW
jgi:hypothetical protein